MTEATVSLREYLEASIGALRQHGDAQDAAHTQSHAEARTAGLMFWDNHRREHDAEHIAVAKANDALAERLDTMNQFRAQLKDQQATFVTRNVYDERQDASNARFGRLEGFQARLIGMGLVAVLLSGLVGGLLAKAIGL